jgi:uncharacterized pyridoxamine 5'-phosphate oxidase family protein
MGSWLMLIPLQTWLTVPPGWCGGPNFLFWRVRPVSPVRVDPGFVIYVANLRGYAKTAEIAAEPRVELCYLDEAHDQVRITAVAEVVKEADVLQEIWLGNPLLRRYLGTPDNPDLVVYRCVPVRVRFMKEWALEYQEVPLAEVS